MVGHEVFISQMKDQIRIFQKQNRLIMTYFLTISEQAILQNMVLKIYVSFLMVGTRMQKERSHVLYRKAMKVLVIVPVFMPHTIQNSKH